MQEVDLSGRSDTNQAPLLQVSSAASSTEDLSDLIKIPLQHKHPRRLTAPALSTHAAISISSLIGQDRRRLSVPEASVPDLKLDHTHSRLFHIYTASISRLADLTSPERVEITETEYWYTLLALSKFPPAGTVQEAIDLDLSTMDACIDITMNNPKTGNFNTLLLYLLSQLRFMRHMAYDQECAIEVYNTLFLVRVFTKHFIDNLNKLQLHEQFEMDRLAESAPSHSKSSSKRLDIDPQIIDDKKLRAEMLLEELFHVVIYADTSTQQNYEFYNETINLLIVLFSTQLNKSPEDFTSGNYFLDIVMSRLNYFGRGVMTRLISNFIQQVEPPAANGGVLFNAYSYLFTAKKAADGRSSQLARKSAMLSLLLSNQINLRSCNAFRASLQSLLDTNVSASTEVLDVLTTTTEISQVSFRELYAVICMSVSDDETSLFLYLLLIQNHSFRTYVLSRTDPETLLLPLLKIVYDASTPDTKPNYSQLYILLVIILLFSQDAEYNDVIQRILIPTPAWFTERVLKSVTIGGLCILVLVRTISSNLAVHRDVYFHTNCLAALGNMSMRISNMQSCVAQRFVTLFEGVSRRYLKLQKNVRTLSMEDMTDETHDADTKVYEDIVRLLLEIINSVLSNTLQHNSQLIYALLHKKDMFEAYKNDVKFGGLIENIDTVIGYFHGKVSALGEELPSTEQVLATIEQASRSWSSNARIKSFPELKFVYEEEKEYALFFLPYIWSLVHKHALIYWSEETVRLWADYDPQEYRDFNVFEI